MTTLSNRGYPMLRTFVDGGSLFHMSVDDAQHYDQRPFRSMLMRGWVVYKPGRGFVLSKDGKRAWEEFQSTDIGRKNPEAPLTAFFDPSAYGLAPKKARTVKKKRSLNSEIKRGTTLREVLSDLRTGAVQ